MSGKHASKRGRTAVDNKRFYATLTTSFLAFVMLMGTLSNIFGG